MDEAPRELDFWSSWYCKWMRRIECLPKRGKDVRPSQVLTAWIRLEMPVVEAHYRMPDDWLALSPEQKRTRLPRPDMIIEYRRVRTAAMAKPGFSSDDVGPYWKLPDGEVLRDRRQAAHRMRRFLERRGDVVPWVDRLVSRQQDGRFARGRTAERVLEALVCRSLVLSGASQVAASRTVIAWSGVSREAERHAEINRTIWREVGVPSVNA